MTGLPAPRRKLAALAAVVSGALALVALILATVPGWAKPPPRATSASSRGAGVLVRVNQVGFGAGSPKQATVMSERPLSRGRFAVVVGHGRQAVLRGGLGRSRGAFNARWRYVYRIDFTRLHRTGRYTIVVAGTRSLPVTVTTTAAATFGPLTTHAVSFFQSQRDGPHVIPGPLHRSPSHLSDARATVYRTPVYRGTRLVSPLTSTGAQVDASGGWFDAGDYLKFVETASFNDVMLLFTLRTQASGVADPGALSTEARFGTDWLLKMWDQGQRVLHYQVGIGDGNGHSVLGDHDLWRLPQADDHRQPRPGSPTYFVSHRPVLAANSPGQPISPNLAGRMAGAFALCAQVYAASDPTYARRCLTDAQTIYDLADTNPRRALLTTSPHAYYDEQEWRDDMQLGASELYLATQALGSTPGLAHSHPGYYLSLAGKWANAYINSPLSGRDSLNLYDVSSLADYDLVRILQSPEAQRLEAQDPNVNVATSPRALLADRADQLRLGAKLSRRDPFALANPSTNVDTVPHALGYAIEARLYDLLTRTRTYEGLAQVQLAWVLGANPWGSSFVVGAGRVFPHCLAHQVANLSGSLTGRGAAILLGATVDGPSSLANVADLGAPDGFRRCPARGNDRFRTLIGRGTAYRDDVRSSSTSEPSDDYAALALLAFAQQSSGA